MTDAHDAAALRLDATGQRYTRGRRALVEVLVGAERPLTLPEILLRRSDLPQSSAYRHLADLERAGVVRRVVATDEHSHFELAEDLTEHHHHLICSGCGSVDDFTLPAEVERLLERSLEEAAAAAGFTTDHHRLDLVGTCRRCAG